MTSYLKWPDYLILVGFLLVSLAIGVYHSLTGGRQKTTSEFILANKKMRVIPTAISLLVSFQSATSLLGGTAEMYCYGIQHLIFTVITKCLAFIVTERVIIPWLYPLKLVSMFEYLERRYMSKSVRIFGASLEVLQAILYSGVVIYAPSAALESVTGLSLKVSIPIMVVVAMTYTALGGMRAVIWTDVFQFLMMLGGFLAIFIKGLTTVGGISHAVHLMKEEGRLAPASLSFDPRERHTVWNMLIGFSFLWIRCYGVSQASVQRFSAVDKMSKARIIMLICIPQVVCVYSMYAIISFVVFAYFTMIKCDPLVNKDIRNPNQILPYFVGTIFADTPGFGGLFLSTLYGLALSSVSSSFSGAAANIWEDILKWKLEKIAESKKALINRILVLVIGALSTLVAFLSASVQGPLTQVVAALYGSIGGSLMGVFLLGGISKKANWKGCLIGGVLGLFFSLWLSIGSLTMAHKYPTLPPLSTEGCLAENSNFTSLSEGNLSFPLSFMTSNASQWNDTFEYIPPDINSQRDKKEFHGLENFYAISYTLFIPFGLFVTSFLGFIASLIFKDPDLEKIDESLLIRFRNCGCRDETETTNSLKEDNEDNALSMECQVIKDTENGLIPSEASNRLTESKDSFCMNPEDQEIDLNSEHKTTKNQPNSE